MITIPKANYTNLEWNYIIQSEIDKRETILQVAQSNVGKVGNLRKEINEAENLRLAKKLYRKPSKQLEEENQTLMITLKSEINQLRNKILKFQPTKIENVNQLILDLVGGTAIYERIPSINLGKRIHSHGAINFITPEMMMPYPLVKFTDALGRQGMAICVFDNTEAKFKVQTFYQEIANSPDWITSGERCIAVDGKYLIKSGTLDTHAYGVLKLYIAAIVCKSENLV